MDNVLAGLIVAGLVAFLVFLPLGLEFYRQPQLFRKGKLTSETELSEEPPVLMGRVWEMVEAIRQRQAVR